MVEDAGASSLFEKVWSHIQDRVLEQKFSMNTYQDDDTETTGRKEQVDPGFNLADLDVESRGDNTSLVQSAVELDDDLASTVVIDLLELADVAYHEMIR